MTESENIQSTQGDAAIREDAEDCGSTPGTGAMRADTSPTSYQERVLALLQNDPEWRAAVEDETITGPAIPNGELRQWVLDD